MDFKNNMERIRGVFLTLDSRHIPYILEVILYLPVLVFMHLWMMFSPHSEHWILIGPCFVMRYGGSLFLFSKLNNTRSQILYFYALAMPFLFIGTLINSCQLSAQNEAPGNSIFPCYKLLLVTIVVVIYCLLYLTPQLILLKWWHTVVILALISLVFLVSSTIFVYFVYWSCILFFITISFFDIIESAVQVRNNVGPNENLLNCAATFIVNRFTKFPFCHIFSLLFFSYYTYAVICELYNGMPVEAFGSLSNLINIIGKWCTSFIVLTSILSCLVLTGKIMIIGIRYCLINKREDRQWMVQLFHTNLDFNISIFFYDFAVLVLFLNLNEEERGYVMNVMLQFTLAKFFNVIWPMLKSFITQTGASVADRHLRVYIEVFICIMGPIVVSLLVSLNIASQFELGIWSALCTLQCFKIVFDAILTFVEYTINMISWFYDIDFMKTQDTIYYISLSRNIGIIICFFFEMYHGMFFPLFPQNIVWLIMVVLGQSIILIRFNVIPTLLSEYVRHVQRTESRADINSLPIATPEQLSDLHDVCGICINEIEEGLVTPCRHIFHRECLKRACAIRPSCPLCNSLIFQNIIGRTNIQTLVENVNQIDKFFKSIISDEDGDEGDDEHNGDNEVDVDDDDDDDDNDDDDDDEIGVRYRA